MRERERERERERHRDEHGGERRPSDPFIKRIEAQRTGEYKEMGEEREREREREKADARDGWAAGQKRKREQLT